MRVFGEIFVWNDRGWAYVRRLGDSFFFLSAYRLDSLLFSVSVITKIELICSSHKNLLFNFFFDV